MEQNTEKVPVKDDAQLKDAIDSIAVIRSVIDRASVNMRSLAPLLIAMGGSQILLTLLRLFVFPIALRLGSGPEGVAAAIYVLHSLSYASAAALFVLFICMRRKYMRTENSYTMKLYDMWGTVIFGIYPLSLLVAVSMAAAMRLGGGDAAMFASLVLDVVQFAAVCMCLYFTGLLGDRLWLKILSGILVFGLIILYCAGLGWLGVDDSFTDALSVFNNIAVRGGIAGLLTNVVYLIVGICFIIKQGGNGNGNN